MLRRTVLTLVTLATAVGTVVSLAAPAQAAHTIPPSTPAAPTGTAGDGQVGVSWTAPSSINPITSYTVRTYAAGTLVGTTTVSGSPPATSTTVTGLTNGTAYTFTVTATQLFGISSAASAESAAVTPVGLPGAPTSVAATAGVASVTVTWQPPTSTGGTPVTGYVATLAPGGGSCSGGASDTSCQVTSLTNGTTYTATVQATNAAGTGSPSSGVTATPLPVPPVPVGLTSSGTGDAVQSAPVALPPGGSLTLLDGVTPVTTFTVAGQGTYAVGAGGDTITFAPVPGFVGVAIPATYAVVDSYAQRGTATYTPTVQAPAPAPAPAPVPAPPAPSTRAPVGPTVRVAVAAPVVALPARTGALLVTCSTSAGALAGCEVRLSASVDGRLLVVGSGSAAEGGAVDARLTRRGRDLVDRPGGRRMFVKALVTLDDGTVRVARTVVTVVPQRVELERTVRFDAGSEDLRRAAAAFAGSLGRRLEGVRAVTCIGHTDDRGTRAYNADLSRHRARAVCDLVAADLDVRRRVEGRGEARPVATNSTSAGRAANRRVVIVLRY